MNMKVVWGVVIVLVLAGLAWFFFGAKTASSPTEENAANTTVKETVVPGTYTVDTASSKVTWSGKKPLIDGYINSGTIGLKEGTLSFSGEAATGSFTFDMNTIQVGLTAKKPGQEGALEGHLKSEKWFDVAKYPTGMFVITKVEKMPDSDTTHVYSITGDLTLKGVTNSVTFPAKISMTEGTLHAEASFEIDRTKWGLTMGSGNFFKNLGDNVIADEIAIGFVLSAVPQQ
jgi:polyisoprenoid-binding protein YceI